MRLKLPVSLRGTPQGIGNSGFPEVKYPNVSEWKICSKLNPRSVLFSQVSNLGPPVGVKAGKRNKASALDHGFRRGAHRRVRAAVAQVVLVVRKLLLIIHDYCLAYILILNLLYAVDRIVQRLIITWSFESRSMLSLSFCALWGENFYCNAFATIHLLFNTILDFLESFKLFECSEILWNLSGFFSSNFL